MQPHHFIIDCDTGRDDALGIWISLSLNLGLRAVISSYGNTSLENVHNNNRQILALADGGYIPVFKGMSAPNTKHRLYHDLVLPRQDKAGNGLCNLTLPDLEDNKPKTHGFKDFAEWLRQQTQKTKTPIDYVVTGPATNLATLITQMGSEIKDYIRSVTMMGGKFGDLWNQMPSADFNVACDPFAIQTIFESGLKVRFVPINATWPIVMNLPEIEALSPKTDLACIAKDLMIAHCKFFSPEPVFRFHDPTVIMALSCPEAFQTIKATIIYDEAHSDFGRLIPSDTGFMIDIFHPIEAMHSKLLQQMLDALSLSS